MTIIISSKNYEKSFTDKEIINIGSNPDCDYVINSGFDFILTLQYDKNLYHSALIDSSYLHNLITLVKQIK